MLGKVVVCSEALLIRNWLHAAGAGLNATSGRLPTRLCLSTRFSAPQASPPLPFGQKSWGDAPEGDAEAPLDLEMDG